MKRSVITLLATLCVFIGFAFFIGKAYKAEQHKPRDRYPGINNETIQRLRNIIGKLRNNDHPAIHIWANGPWNWENEKDYGNQGEEWAKEEDPNFIVYYHKDKEAIWQGRAQNILKCANEFIPTIESVMGQYHYPYQQYDRKLAFYLAKDKNDYAQTSKQVGGSYLPNSLGVTFTTMGRYGCKTEGIVLNPTIFSVPPSDINGYRKVVPHEMAHHNHYASINIGQNFNLYNWECEGIAEYICARHEGATIFDQEKIRKIERECHLEENFPDGNGEPYWAGESFFLYIKDKYGEKGVKEFMTHSYNSETDSLCAPFGHTLEEEHNAWVRHLKGDTEPKETNRDSTIFASSF